MTAYDENDYNQDNIDKEDVKVDKDYLKNNDNDHPTVPLSYSSSSCDLNHNVGT